MVQLLNRQSSHFFDPYLPEFSSPQSVEILWPYCRNHIENATPLWSIQSWKCHPIQWHIPITLLRGITPPGGRVSCQIAVIIFALFTFPHQILCMGRRSSFFYFTRIFLFSMLFQRFLSDTRTKCRGSYFAVRTSWHDKALRSHWGIWHWTWPLFVWKEFIKQPVRIVWLLYLPEHTTWSVTFVLGV